MKSYRRTLSIKPKVSRFLSVKFFIYLHFIGIVLVQEFSVVNNSKVVIIYEREKITIIHFFSISNSIFFASSPPA